MKKIIALSLCLVLVLSLCACGAKEDLTGKWTTTINMAESYNAEMAAADPTMAEYMSLDSFNIPLVLELKADGTYTMTVTGMGSYTGTQTKVVLVAIRKQQLAELKELVMDLDPSAFVIVQEAHQVLGDGFLRYSRHSL